MPAVSDPRRRAMPASTTDSRQIFDPLRPRIERTELR